MILDGTRLRTADLRRIGKEIERGGIIGFPTDTVYGLGCDAFNPAAVARMYALKKRKRTKPFVLFVSARSQVNQYAQPNAAATRLIDGFLPGPLTVIMTPSDSSPAALVRAKRRIGVRVPDNGIILEVLRMLPTPLATTSANRSGEEEATTAQMVTSRFIGGEIEMVIDGGPCDHPPSAVVDTTSIPAALLRKGRISILEIEKTLEQEIRVGQEIRLVVLFVCTGNSCRSPMASGLLKRRLSGVAKRKVRVVSAGTSTIPGLPPTDFACEAAKEHGFDISLNRSRVLSRDMLERADLVIGFERHHLTVVSQLLPEASPRSFLLKEFGRARPPKRASIADPVRGGLKVYERCMEEIDGCMGRLVDYLEGKFR